VASDPRQPLRNIICDRAITLRQEKEPLSPRGDKPVMAQSRKKAFFTRIGGFYKNWRRIF